MERARVATWNMTASRSRSCPPEPGPPPPTSCRCLVSWQSSWSDGVSALHNQKLPHRDSLFFPLRQDLAFQRKDPAKSWHQWVIIFSVRRVGCWGVSSPGQPEGTCTTETQLGAVSTVGFPCRTSSPTEAGTTGICGAKRQHLTSGNN